MRGIFQNDMKMSKDVLMKMYKDGRSTDKNKLVKNLLLNVEKSLANLSSNGMASSILYESMSAAIYCHNLFLIIDSLCLYSAHEAKGNLGECCRFAGKSYILLSRVLRSHCSAKLHGCGQ